MTLVLAMLTTMTAWATTTSTINVGGTDYTLFTGFTATAGTETYANFVDGNTSTKWHVMKNMGENANDFAGGTEDPAYVEFHADAPIIPKGYVLTYDNSINENWKPTSWALKAKQNESDEWTTIHSSNSSLGNGSRFEIACNNNGDNQYQYFRFEIYDVGSTYQSILSELEFYGSSPDVYYTHLTVRAATCTETGIKQDCYLRNDGKYFTDETGTTALQESDVIEPMIPHSGQHHDATDTNIEYWQCSMCSKYFSDGAYTTEITEEDTKIYRTITIDDGISSLVTSSVDKALAGATVTLTLSHLIDTSTLQVNSGSVTLADAGNGTYTFTVPAADVTVTASILSTYSITLPANMAIVSATNAADSNGKYISGTVIKFAASFGYAATNVSDGTNTLEPDADGIYTVTFAEADINITATTESSNTLYLARATSDFTAVDGNILIGSTSHTVTIANNAKITLSDVTITGGIVCAGTAEITLVGANSISGLSRYDSNIDAYRYTAGIQVGGSGTTLTIKGNGSLTANGGNQSAGIGLSALMNYDSNVSSGNIVIEGGTITATGGHRGAGIGTGVIKNTNNDNSTSVQFGNVTIKGGTVTATGGDSGDGIGKGYSYPGPAITFGTVTIYDGIEMVDASSISESIVYMHETTNVTASKADYFTIIENGNRRIIVQKVTPAIADVPDQTYTGSEITPEPTVIAGSLSLTKGTDYVYSYTNNTNVGTAKVRATFRGDYESLGYVEKEFTITKATPTVTAPTAIADLVYTGSAQALVTGGTTDVGDILSYCLEENGMYSADIPTGTNAGTYTVYYKVDGSDNWNAVAGGTVEVPISPKAVTVTAEAKSKEYGAADPDLTATVEGLVGKDAISYTVSRTAGEAVGEYTITPTGEAAQGNYTVSFVAGTLAITAKTVTDNNALKVTQDQNGYHATFTGSANDAVNIPDAITVKSVTLERNFSNGKYATLMLPFTMTDGMTLTGAKIYQFVGVEKVEGQWIATMQTPTSPLQANTPYLVEPVTSDLTDGKVTFDLNGGMVTLKTETSNEGSTNSDWQFVGTYTRLTYGTTPFTGNAYGFASKDKTVDGIEVKAGEFVYAKEGAAVPPLRCFLKYKNGEEFNGARAMSRHASATDEMPQTITVRLLGANGETTGIGTLDTRTGEFTTDGWYDMNGRKLSGKPTKKGLYINNGKKIVIK